MKIKITESQYQRLVEYEDDGGTSENILKYKEAFFKYWDRFGPGITPKMFKVFGLNFYKRYEYKKLVYDMLMEYIGEETAINKTYEYLRTDDHHIDCGGYDYTFNVTEIKFTGKIARLTVLVNDKDGEVQVISDDDTPIVLNLADAINDEEIGFEIRGEIYDCIEDYLTLNVEDKFGVVCHLEIINYESKI